MGYISNQTDGSLSEIERLQRRIAELESVTGEMERVVAALQASCEQFRNITDALPTIISYVDSDQRYRFTNRAYSEWFGLSAGELNGRGVMEVLGSEGYLEIRDYVETALAGKAISHERAVATRDGGVRHVNASYVPHLGPSGEVLGFVSLGVDITERIVAAEAIRKANDELERRVEERTRQLKLANEHMVREMEERRIVERRLTHLSKRDVLTGLHNRMHFEECIRALDSRSVLRYGVLVCDVDGLKLINDSFGPRAGDELLTTAAHILKKCSRPGDTVARIGGDEFGILIRGGTGATVEKASRKIRSTSGLYSAGNLEIPLSISVGAAATGRFSKISDVFREAENNMYREKLFSSRSARSGILQTLMTALEARDFVTEGHVNRLQELVTRLGGDLGMPESKVGALRLFAQFHDIGKVGISDLVLFKSGPLNSVEKEEMKRHSEIGHRIALASPDLASIAEWILMHHEWWNGGGYPIGLRGVNIPLECRILAVADAFDAMTSMRPYREAWDRGRAVAELERCAGIQFDPELVQAFMPRLSQMEHLIINN